MTQVQQRVAVTGATGRVGRHLVEVLTARGYDVVPISRSGGVDLVTGEGLEAALSGVECVIDAATTPSPDQVEATAYFTAATCNLQEVGARAGVQRIVAISIVGADRFTSGYIAAKIAHEQAMLAGPIPARILRATQFHEFVQQFIEWGRQGDVSYVQQMRTQLVAARAVAEVAAGLVIDPWPAGAPIVNVGGPRAESTVEVAKLFVARRGIPLRIEGISDPSNPDRDLYESGALLLGQDAILAGPTFEEWLTAAEQAPQQTAMVYPTR